MGWDRVVCAIAILPLQVSVQTRMFSAPLATLLDSRTMATQILRADTTRYVAVKSHGKVLNNSIIEKDLLSKPLRRHHHRPH